MTDFHDDHDPTSEDGAPDKGAASNEGRDYEVGFGKPPKHTRFKKGQSGYPKGRPKGTRNLKTDAKAALAIPVKINKDGKTKNVSSQYAVILKLREKALKGDARAMDRIIHLAMTFNGEDVTPIKADLSEEDEAILSQYTNRILAGAKRAASHPEDEQSDGAASEQEPNGDPSEDPEEDDDGWLYGE